MGIGETLRRALAKFVMRASGGQAKTTCGNLQLCAGLEAGIEGATHAVGQRRVERVRARRAEEEGAPYMPALRPAHSCRFLHAVFAWSPADLMTSLTRALQSVPPMPRGAPRAFYLSPLGNMP